MLLKLREQIVSAASMMTPRTYSLRDDVRFTGREISKVIRRSIAQPKQEKTTTDVAAVLGALQQLEARRPGSVLLQIGRSQRTVILIGQDLLTGPYSQEELALHEIPRSSQANSVSDTPVLGPG